jgi:hypothetical protein
MKHNNSRYCTSLPGVYHDPLGNLEKEYAEE